MSNYIKGINVNQMSFMPFSLDEMIEEDNPVRGISSVVDALDKDALNFNHSQTKKTGRPPYDPIVMFKIYLYCYYNKIRSSRLIEKECKRNLSAIGDGAIGDVPVFAHSFSNNTLKRAISGTSPVTPKLLADDVPYDNEVAISNLKK